MEISEFQEAQREFRMEEQLNLPEHVELLEGQDAASEQSSGPYQYSEAYLDDRGRYHPQQITGVYKEALQDPDCRETASELGNWGMQEKQMSCAVRTQMMIGNEDPKNQYSESQLRRIAEGCDWYADDRGTFLSDIGKVAELCYGMERQQFENVTVEDLESMKQQGAELIITVDQALLARPYLGKPTTPDHAVEVIGFDHSEQGNPKIILNDPGRSDGCGAAYPLEMFKRAAYVTDRDTGLTGIRSVTALYQGGKS